jgi:dipeptidyl aminopeptidase/acylaminoacyl peptidase
MFCTSLNLFGPVKNYARATRESEHTPFRLKGKKKQHIVFHTDGNGWKSFSLDPDADVAAE